MPMDTGGAVEVEIRLLQARDRALLEAVAPEVFDNAVDPRLADMFIEDPRHHMVVALGRGIVVGMASAVDYLHPDKPRELWINEVAVAPSYRRSGVGRRLVEALLDHGRSLGCREAWLLTEHDNEPAKRLYAAVGARTDAVLMYAFDLTRPA
jgi:ribosomal protein S18 acetylase RimI-like enzyme